MMPVTNPDFPIILNVGNVDYLMISYTFADGGYWVVSALGAPSQEVVELRYVPEGVMQGSGEW